MDSESAVNFGQELIRRVHAARWDQDMPDNAAAEVYWMINDRVLKRCPSAEPDGPQMIEALVRYAGRQFDIQEAKVRSGLA